MEKKKQNLVYLFICMFAVAALFFCKTTVRAEGMVVKVGKQYVRCTDNNTVLRVSDTKSGTGKKIVTLKSGRIGRFCVDSGRIYYSVNFTKGSSTSSKIYSLRTDGTGKKYYRSFARDTFVEAYYKGELYLTAAFYDGTILAYESTYRLNLKTKKVTSVKKGYGVRWEDTIEGNYLFLGQFKYDADQTTSVYSVNIKNGKVKLLDTQISSVVQQIGSYVYYARRQDGKIRVYCSRPDGSKKTAKTPWFRATNVKKFTEKYAEYYPPYENPKRRYYNS